MDTNRLFYGDNLEVLQRYVLNDSIDLVYLDPPFNSNANYNLLFAEKSGTKAAAQIKAFEDTWQWDESAAEAYRKVVEANGWPRLRRRGARESCRGGLCPRA